MQLNGTDDNDAGSDLIYDDAVEKCVDLGGESPIINKTFSCNLDQVADTVTSR